MSLTLNQESLLEQPAEVQNSRLVAHQGHFCRGALIHDIPTGTLVITAFALLMRNLR
jgi:hypothetical protein